MNNDKIKTNTRWPILSKVMGVIYEEDGYRTIGREPTEEELPDIEQRSEQHVSECKATKKEIDKAFKECDDAMWRINHPIKAFIVKCKKLFNKGD